MSFQPQNLSSLQEDIYFNNNSNFKQKFKKKRLGCPEGLVPVLPLILDNV
jgi:hypothetical protein